MTKFGKLCITSFTWLICATGGVFALYCLYAVFRDSGAQVGLGIMLVLLIALFMGYEAAKRIWDGSFSDLLPALVEGETVTIQSVDPDLVDIDKTRLYLVVRRFDGKRMACYAWASDFDSYVEHGVRFKRRGDRLVAERRRFWSGRR